MAQAERERETEFGILKESIQKVIKALYYAHNDDFVDRPNVESQKLMQFINHSPNAELNFPIQSYSQRGTDTRKGSLPPPTHQEVLWTDINPIRVNILPRINRNMQVQRDEQLSISAMNNLVRANENFSS